MKWHELPDGTLLRDVQGDLRLVHHSADSVWLWHWSDEYSPWFDDRGEHGNDRPIEPFTVVTVAEAPSDGQ